MLTIDSCSTTEVDRLLGLGDQFLEDWAEDAVQGGKRDEDYEQRFAEWSVIRPLLLSAPALLRALQTDRLFLSGLRRADGGTLRGDRSNRDVFLTDLYGSFPDSEPTYPVLWASTGGRRAPFGQVIPMQAA